MPAFQTFDQFPLDLLEAKHNFSTHVFKVMLVSSTPLATDAVKADLSEVASGNGYTTGGATTTITATVSSGVGKVSGTGVTFTASGGNVGPFRYAALYNDTQASPLKPLVAWWDYGLDVTMVDQEQFTVTFDAVNGIFTLSS